MTAYLTFTELLKRVSHDDLAERAAPDDKVVTGRLLAAYVAGTLPREGDNKTVSDTVFLAVVAAAERLSAHLADVNGLVAGYLRSRYPTLATVPEALRTAALDIFLFRVFGSDADDRDGRRAGYRRAIAFLQAVNAGTVDLAAPDGEADTALIESRTAGAEVFRHDGPMTDYLSGL